MVVEATAAGDTVEEEEWEGGRRRPSKSASAGYGCGMLKMFHVQFHTVNQDKGKKDFVCARQITNFEKGEQDRVSVDLSHLQEFDP